MIDLHCHSTFSDGTLTPTQLMDRALAAGLQALALTDHDTIAGWSEARAVAADHGIEFVPGVELSTLHEGNLVHILGFYPEPQRLQTLLAMRLEGRHRRTERILKTLAQLGMPVSLAQGRVKEAPGRPHIAAAMVEAGYVKDKAEAFDLWIGEGKPAYVAYEPYDAVQGISDIVAAGGVAVWAHPGLYSAGDLGPILELFIEAGLQGVEAFHPCHSETQTAWLVESARKRNLIMTGGSDYHGPQAGAVDGGHGELGSMAIPDLLLGELKGRRRC